eukprot:TRINITY_DN19087_c0_g1_i2.p1 TRINITY_DN19087_c0_g1~~TRINITY_DN19087_c0_g1_i2.p1  ORF type:complete len:363 (+),score=50.02 TRINITY_DN19087_c0_g1_i2:105-1193(+)
MPQPPPRLHPVGSSRGDAPTAGARHRSLDAAARFAAGRGGSLEQFCHGDESAAAILAAIPTPVRNRPRGGLQQSSPRPRSSTPTRSPARGDASPAGLGKLAYGWMQKCRQLLPGPRARQAWNCVTGDRDALDPEHLSRCLYLAADGGQLHRAEALLKRGAKPDHRTPGGWTALLRAAFHGDIAMTKLLLRAGASVNACSNSGHTALELCVLGGPGHLPLLGPLLAANADPEMNDFLAVRRALEKKGLDALTAFGPDWIFKVYQKDQEDMKALKEAVDDYHQERGDLPDSSRELARKQTLVGILESSDLDDSSFSCVVCFEAPRSVVLQPCLHLVLCEGCAPKFSACPICRKDVRSTVAAFLS